MAIVCMEKILTQSMNGMRWETIGTTRIATKNNVIWNWYCKLDAFQIN